MKHLRNILNGIASVLCSISSNRSYVATLGGFAKDSKALAGDVRIISKNIKKQSGIVYGTYTAAKSKKR